MYVNLKKPSKNDSKDRKPPKTSKCKGNKLRAQSIQRKRVPKLVCSLERLSQRLVRFFWAKFGRNRFIAEKLIEKAI